MRSFYSIRSIGISSAVILASLISLFIITAPASAEVIPLDAGYHLLDKHQPDIAYLVYDILPAAEVSRIERTVVEPMIAFAETLPLKPEYAESYASAGQNFIDLRRRC